MLGRCLSGPGSHRSQLIFPKEKVVSERASGARGCSTTAKRELTWKDGHQTDNDGDDDDADIST